jgi:hypothetical protein
MAFPYTDEETKNTGFEKTWSLNNGTQVHGASYFNGYQVVDGSASEYWWSLTNNVNNPSKVVNIQNYIVATSGRTVTFDDFNYVVNNIHGNDQGRSYYTSEEYITRRDRVIDKLVWIWGSLDDGGLVCFRPTPNEIAIYMIDGFFTIPAQGVPGDPDYHDATYGYSVNPVASPVNVNDFDWTRVCWFMNAIEYSNHPEQYQFYGYMRVGTNTNINQKCSVALFASPSLYEYEVAVPLTSINIIEQIPSAWLSNIGGNGAIFTLDAREFFMWDPGHVFTGKERLSGNPWGNSEIDDEDNPYYDSGFNNQGGGGASLDNNVDTSNPEDADIDNNSVDVCSSDLVLMYNPTPSEISSFNNFLYSGITDNIANTLKKLTSDPLQYIISLGLVHFDPPTGVRTNISFGGVDTNVSALRISKQMKSFDFGYIDLRNEFKSFVDYNSRASIYLPYIGYREIDINEVRGSRIRLKYNIDMLTGSCVAYLHISRDSRGNGDCRIYNNMYFFEGNCLLQIPMFATDNRGAVQALMNTLGAGVSLATGNVAGAVTGAVNAVTQQKVAVGRAGTIGSNYGYMSGQEAFIVIERPIISVPLNFGAYEGWTSNINEKVANLSGYTEIDPDTMWSDNFGHATAEECDMIKTIMNGGVYL